MEGAEHIFEEDPIPSHVREAFNDLDKDGDGSLSFDEVRSSLHDLSLPPNYAQTVFRDMGLEPGQRVSVKEFAAWAGRKQQLVKTVFDSLDRSGDGRLTVRDLKVMMHHLNLHVDAKQLMKKLDKDADGQLSWQEFRQAFVLVPAADMQGIEDTWLEYMGDTDVGTMSGLGTTTDVPKPGKVPVPAWTSAVAGAIGNAFSRTAIAPLERTRMQMIADPGKYASILGCMRSIMQKEGVKGYWAGNSINVMRIAPQGAIGFFAKDYFKQLFAGEGNKPSPLQTLGASMCSGVCCQTGVYPLDVIRTRMTTTPGLYNGVADGFRKIYSKEGTAGLFKGLWPANAFAVPYYGTQFFVYDMLKVAYTTWGRPSDSPRPMHPLLGIPFGSVASCTACVVAFPFQMAWKRIQVQGVGGRPVLYKGPADCLRQVIRSEGARGVYAGLPANLVKLAPTGALTFLAVEVVKRVMGWNPK